MLDWHRFVSSINIFSLFSASICLFSLCSTDAEVRPEDSFKFHYVFKGPKKDGNQKKLYYVYGTHLSAKDEGIKQEPYRPVGKGYNWPESYRKANNLYYELTFPEQGESEFKGCAVFTDKPHSFV